MHCTHALHGYHRGMDATPWTHGLSPRPCHRRHRAGRVNRALPVLSRQVRRIATDGVEQPGALPVGWVAREPWLGASRYAPDPQSPRNRNEWRGTNAKSLSRLKAFRLTDADGTDLGVWPGADPEGALMHLAAHYGEIDDDGIEAVEVTLVDENTTLDVGGVEVHAIDDSLVEVLPATYRGTLIEVLVEEVAERCMALGIIDPADVDRELVRAIERHRSASVAMLDALSRYRLNGAPPPSWLPYITARLYSEVRAELAREAA